ncbi:phosphate/phosphite/phosphonate ABC transporter substrate-binding protein [Shimia sp.]|uniref:phosphate/phosphite/phosphonate ABC transporter substrate-binding protein n=1 Tax=Shimia sp. TaxID=1954381 RepID=UPI003B8CD00E
MLRLKEFIAPLSILFCCAAPFETAAETLTIGTLTEGIREQMKIYEPLANHLEANLQDVGVTEVRVMMLPSSDQMARAMGRGEVDVFFDSALVAAKVAQNSGASPFMRNWKNGRNSDHSVIVVRADSGIETLFDLRGQRIAFEEPDSTTGFLLPAHIISEHGISLSEIRSFEAPPASDEIGYVFTTNDKNSIYMLAIGRVDAAATNPEGFSLLQTVRPEEFRVIASSQSVPSQVLLTRRSLDENLVNRMREELSGLFRTTEGRAVLKAFHNSAGFDEFPSGSKAAFTPIYHILEDLQRAGIN